MEHGDFAEKIADRVIEKMNSNFQCPNGMTSDDTQQLRELLPHLKEFVTIYKKGKFSLQMFIIAMVGIGMATAFVWGLIETVTKTKVLK